MTFRSRLLLSIVGVVVGTTAVSLYIAHSQNAESYRAVVDEMFRREAVSFQREQQTSLESASQQAAKLAESVRLFAALEAEDESVYQVAKDEMRLGDFSFFRLASANGKLVAPPSDYVGLEPAADSALQQQLGLLPTTSTQQTATSTGVVALPETGTTKLYRILLSPIAQTYDGKYEHMGWLVLAQRFIQHAEAGETSALQSGVLHNGKLFSPTMPKDLASSLAHAITPTVVVPSGEYRAESIVLNAKSILPTVFLVTAFSLADFHARQRSITSRIITMGALALLLATLIASTLSRQLAEPVQRMVAATREIEKGNFAISLPADRTEELDTLSRSINDMAAGLAMKERYQSVLQMVADEQIANELIHGELRLGGELRQVSMIFCDIRGYTTLSATMAPAEVIALLNEHMGALTRIVHQRRGVVSQFSGDCIMVLFGAPKSYGSDALDAALCAIDMMKARQQMNATAEHPLHIGIGIASGEVIAGCLGAEQRAEYTVIGERVNLAARLCSSASAGEILIDQSTRAQWPTDSIECVSVEPLSLKGYAQPVPAWRVLAATSPSHLPS